MHYNLLMAMYDCVRRRIVIVVAFARETPSAIRACPWLDEALSFSPALITPRGTRPVLTEDKFLQRVRCEVAMRRN